MFVWREVGLGESAGLPGSTLHVGLMGEGEAQSARQQSVGMESMGGAHG